MTDAGPLVGLVVLDLTRVLAGPFATMMLADLGARVIKVETPGSGDDARQFGPFVNGKSAYFMPLNRGKQSIALDLKADTDRSLIERLIEVADILVENFRPGTMEKLGYGWPALQRLNPRLIYAAISGFGQTGPYAERPAYDMVVQAMGGIMSVTGHPGSDPVRVGTSVGDITAGLFGLNGILAAVIDRQKTGKGAMVDIGMLDCQVAILENAIAHTLASGAAPGPLGARHPSITPFDAFTTADGHIVIAAGTQALFEKLCAAIGRSELTVDPAFSTNALRTDNEGRLKAELEATLAGAGSAHWLRVIGDAGVPCGPINDIAQVIADPQVNARNMIVEAIDPIAGPVRMAGNPIKMSTSPDPPRRAPAPELDADRERILSTLLGTGL